MKLGQRGVAALEFCLSAVPLFLLIFAIFDFGRYAITLQSLRMLADAGARAMMINCYTGKVVASQSPSTCTGDPLSASAEQAVAPFLFAAGLTPTLTVTATTANGSNVLRVTASQPGFAMMTSLWPSSFNAPSASTSVPY